MILKTHLLSILLPNSVMKEKEMSTPRKIPGGIFIWPQHIRQFIPVFAKLPWYELSEVLESDTTEWLSLSLIKNTDSQASLQTETLRERLG